MTLTFAHIHQCLGAHTPELQPVPQKVRARASVALILAGTDDALKICVIRRAMRDDDAWSGHMAFPGGRASERDASPIATAMRETHEEVGIALKKEHYVGALDEIELHGRGQTQHGVLSPFVFAMPDTQPLLTPDPREVAEAYWIDVHALIATESFTTYEFTHPDTHDMMAFPGIAHLDQIIWGLTYRVFADFAHRINLTMPEM